MSDEVRKYYYVGPVSEQDRTDMSDADILGMKAAFIATYDEAQKVLDLDSDEDDVGADHDAKCTLIAKELKARADAGEQALMAILGTKDTAVLSHVSDTILADIPDIYVVYERRN